MTSVSDVFCSAPLYHLFPNPSSILLHGCFSSCVEFLSKLNMVQPHRTWVNCRHNTRLHSQQHAALLRIMTYNILAQNLLLRHDYLYKFSPPPCLEWKNRIYLILKQIHDQNPDILCLQEVRWPDMQNDFAPFLSERGYAWCYHRKSPHSPLQHEDGVALIYRTSVLELLQWKTIDFNLNQFLNRDNVALLAHFRFVGTSHTIYVATTHLLYNPRRQDVRLGQMHYLLTQLIQFMERGDSPILLCGDFNSEPDSLLYRFLICGQVNFFMGENRRKATIDHPFHFDSLYPGRHSHAECITSVNSCDVHYVDYIFYGYLNQSQWRFRDLGGNDEDLVDSKQFKSHSYPRLERAGYYELPKREEVFPCPNEDEGSDHFHLAGDFAILSHTMENDSYGSRTWTV